MLPLQGAILIITLSTQRDALGQDMVGFQPERKMKTNLHALKGQYINRCNGYLF